MCTRTMKGVLGWYDAACLLPVGGMSKGRISGEFLIPTVCSFQHAAPLRYRDESNFHIATVLVPISRSGISLKA